MNETDRGLTLLGKALDASALRHRVIANNLANVNTPGFKASTVEFGEELKAAMTSGGPGKLASVQPKIVPLDAPAQRKDGNNVDVDRHLTDMVKNSLYYSTLARIVNARIGAFRAAITGRT